MNEQTISATYRNSIPEKPQEKDCNSQRRTRGQRSEAYWSNSDVKHPVVVQNTDYNYSNWINSNYESEEKLDKTKLNNTIDVVSKFRINDYSQYNINNQKHKAKNANESNQLLVKTCLSYNYFVKVYVFVHSLLCFQQISKINLPWFYVEATVRGARTKRNKYLEQSLDKESRNSDNRVSHSFCT